MRFQPRLIPLLMLAGASVTTIADASSAGGPLGSSGNYYSNYQPQQQQEQAQQWYSERGQYAYETTEPVTGEETNAAIPSLPPGWSEHLDPSSGRPYYYNANDGTTTWDRPIPEPINEANETTPEARDDEPVREEERSQVHHGEDQEPETADKPEPEENTQYPGYSEPQQQHVAVEEPQYVDQQPKHQEQLQEQPKLWESQKPEPVQQQHVQYSDGWSRPIRDQSQLRQVPDGWDRPEGNQPQQQQQQQPEGWGRPEHGDHEQNQLAKAWGGPEREAVPQGEQTQPWNPVEHQQTPYTSDRTDAQRPELARRPQWQGETAKVDEVPRNEFSPEVKPGDAFTGPPRQLAPQQQYQKPPPRQERPPEQLQQLPPQQFRPQQQQQRSTLQQQGVQEQRPGWPQPNQQQLPPGYGQQNPYSHQGPSYGQGYGPGYNQYAPYGTPPQDYGQQRLQPQQSQLVNADTSGAVRDALGSAWKGILGFSNRTKEAVGQARQTVVTSATAAGQTITSTSAGLWGQAKNSIGSVFEGSDDKGRQQPYSLSGQYGAPPAPGQPQQQGYPPQQYGGYPPRYSQPQQREIPPYPHVHGPQQGQPPLQSQWGGSQQGYPPQGYPPRQQGSYGPGSAGQYPPYPPRQGGPLQQDPPSQGLPKGQDQPKSPGPDPSQHPGWGSGY